MRREPSRTLLTYFFNNRKTTFLAVILIFGVFCGAIVAKNMSDENTAKLHELFSNFIVLNNSDSFLKSASETIISSMLLPCIVSFLGVSILGFFIIPVVPFFHGLGLGLICSYLYSTFGAKGIGYCAFAFLPGNVLQCLVLIFFCRECMAMSYSMFSLGRGTIQLGQFDMHNELKLYVTRILVFALMMFASALINVFFNSFIGGLFNI